MEEPFGFRSGGNSCSAYYAAEIPDSFAEEEAKIIGELARQQLFTGYYSNGQQAVDRVLSQWKKD